MNFTRPANGSNASWNSAVQYRSSGVAPRITTTLFVSGSSWSMSSTSPFKSKSSPTNVALFANASAGSVRLSIPV